MRPHRLAAPRLAAPLLAVTLAAGLVSCTSDGRSGASSPPPSGPSSTTTGTAQTAALARTLKSGLATVTSAHFDISGTFAGQAFTGAGDQKITAGALDGLQADVTLPGVGAVSIVVDGATRYVKLPPPLVSAARPWVKVTSTSTNVVVKQLAGFLDSALTAGSLGTLGGIADATTTVRTLGSAPVAGVAATRYGLVVDPAKLPGDVASSAALGTATLPVDLWVDAQGRPVQVHSAPSIGGQKTDITIRFGRFGLPVTVSVPPASQVATG